MKAFPLKFFYTACLFGCLNAQMQVPGMQPGPGVQGDLEMPRDTSGVVEGSLFSQATSREKCFIITPPKGLNSTALASGRWYVSKVYLDLVRKKPMIAPVCIRLDISKYKDEVNLHISVYYKDVCFETSGPITNVNYGELMVTVYSTDILKMPLPLKNTVVDIDGNNLLLYTCAGFEGLIVHLGTVLSRQKTANPAFVSKSDQKMKSMGFKREGTLTTNHNCPT